MTHIFPLEDATYLYGLTETIGGLGDFVIPYAAGYIDINLQHGDGLYFIGACAIFGSILLCAPAVFRPALWIPYKKRKNLSENSTHEQENPVTIIFLRQIVLLDRGES